MSVDERVHETAVQILEAAASGLRGQAQDAGGHLGVVADADPDLSAMGAYRLAMVMIDQLSRITGDSPETVVARTREQLAFREVARNLKAGL